MSFLPRIVRKLANVFEDIVNEPWEPADGSIAEREVLADAVMRRPMEVNPAIQEEKKAIDKARLVGNGPSCFSPKKTSLRTRVNFKKGTTEVPKGVTYGRILIPQNKPSSRLKRMFDFLWHWRKVNHDS